MRMNLVRNGSFWGLAAGLQEGSNFCGFGRLWFEAKEVVEGFDHFVGPFGVAVGEVGVVVGAGVFGVLFYRGFELGNRFFVLFLEDGEHAAVVGEFGVVGLFGGGGVYEFGGLVVLFFGGKGGGLGELDIGGIGTGGGGLFENGESFVGLALADESEAEHAERFGVMRVVIDDGAEFLFGGGVVTGAEFFQALVEVRGGAYAGYGNR